MVAGAKLGIISSTYVQPQLTINYGDDITLRHSDYNFYLSMYPIDYEHAGRPGSGHRVVAGKASIPTTAIIVPKNPLQDTLIGISNIVYTGPMLSGDKVSFIAKNTVDTVSGYDQHLHVVDSHIGVPPVATGKPPFYTVSNYHYSRTIAADFRDYLSMYVTKVGGLTGDPILPGDTIKIQGAGGTARDHVPWLASSGNFFSHSLGTLSEVYGYSGGGTGGEPPDTSHHWVVDSINIVGP